MLADEVTRLQDSIYYLEEKVRGTLIACLETKL